MEERGETELLIAKQRNGPTDPIHFVFRNASRDLKKPRRTPGLNPSRLSSSRTQLCRSGTVSYGSSLTVRPGLSIPHSISIESTR